MPTKQPFSPLVICLYAVLAFGLPCVQAGETAPATNTASAPGPLQTVAAIQVPRYMGVWFEIAKYPNSFQKKCVANTQATYSLLADNTVRVVNRCTESDGKVKEAIGTARQIGEASSPRLKVRFAPAWLSFLPMVWGDYWVIDLDPDYKLVAVSEPERNYLWVLSRTPKVEPQAYQQLLGRLQSKGFELSKLERTRQESVP
jgi:apolipoprotein D and lipocalin family protein